MFDKVLCIYPDIDVSDALHCVRSYVKDCQEEPRKNGWAGCIVYVMKRDNAAYTVYQTKTRYVVRKG